MEWASGAGSMNVKGGLPDTPPPLFFKFDHTPPGMGWGGMADTPPPLWPDHTPPYHFCVAIPRTPLRRQPREMPMKSGVQCCVLPKIEVGGIRHTPPPPCLRNRSDPPTRFVFG